MKKLTIEFIREEFAKKGYTLVSDVYVNNKTKLDCICPVGHTHTATYDSFRNGYGCPYCANNIKLTREFISSKFAEVNYILNSTEYINVLLC